MTTKKKVSRPSTMRILSQISLLPYLVMRAAPTCRDPPNSFISRSVCVSFVEDPSGVGGGVGGDP